MQKNRARHRAEDRKPLTKTLLKEVYSLTRPLLQELLRTLMNQWFW